MDQKVVMYKRLLDDFVRIADELPSKQEAVLVEPLVGRWSELFRQLNINIEILSQDISRERLNSIFQEESFTPLDKFIAVMVWGYGDRGYGPFRTSKVLNQVGAKERIEEFLTTTDLSAGYHVFALFAEKPIKGLGISFGTKFLFFASKEPNKLPILDSLIHEYLSSEYPEVFAGLSSRLSWFSGHYVRYLELVQYMSIETDLSVGRIEHVLFEMSSAKIGGIHTWSNRNRPSI